MFPEDPNAPRRRNANNKNAQQRAINAGMGGLAAHLAARREALLEQARHEGLLHDGRKALPMDDDPAYVRAGTSPVTGTPAFEAGPPSAEPLWYDQDVRRLVAEPHLLDVWESLEQALEQTQQSGRRFLYLGPGRSPGAFETWPVTTAYIPWEEQTW